MTKEVLVGHNFQRTALNRLLEQSLLPHALLFSGTSGIGKKLVAVELAYSMLCSSENRTLGGCGSCHTCVLLNHSNHPDFYFIDCLKDDGASVSNIRDLLYKLNLAPYLFGKRVVLIDNAEHMNAQAANALLKSFEEPRVETFFILVTSNLSRLPKTLVSRCQTWHFNNLSSDEISKIIEEKPALFPFEESQKILKLNPEARAALSNGSIEELLNIGTLDDSWHSMEERLKNIILGEVVEALEFAEVMGKQKSTLRQNLHILQSIVRQLMTGEISSITKRRWAACLHNLLVAEDLIFERNISPTYVLSAVFLRLSEAADSMSFTPGPDSVTLHGLISA